MTRVVRWCADDLRQRADEVLEVYGEAMGVSRQVLRPRRAVMAAHLDRPGLAAAAGLEDDGALIGIAYGHVGRRGQWWHDQVAAALEPGTAQRWIDGAFEVCELHVRPARQGTGLGRALLAELLAGPPAPTAVLTTPEGETRARRFYRAGGWVELARELHFPGDPRAFAVLGLDLTEQAARG